MDHETRLRNRVLRYLHTAGPDGLNRSSMVKRGINASELSKTLDDLTARKWIVGRREENTRGPSTVRYFLLIDLTAAGVQVTGEDGLPLVPGIPAELPCQRCGRAMSYSGSGRPPLYCSDGCATTMEAAIRPILDRAHQSNTFAHTCTLLVAADLLSRGFVVGLPTLSIAPQVAVYAANGEVRTVRVLPINLNGKFPAVDQNYPAWALVYRDGRIEYGGPLAVVADDADGSFEPNTPAETAAPKNRVTWCRVCGEKQFPTPDGSGLTCVRGHGAPITDVPAAEE
jgi:hypothetical protein